MNLTDHKHNVVPELEDVIYQLLLAGPRSAETLAAITGESRFAIYRRLRRLMKFTDVAVVTEKKQRFYGVRPNGGRL